MPRSNFQKTQKAYSEETLQIAIAEIEAKKLNKHQASVRFNIPYSTLNDRINEKYKRPANGKGATPWIPKEFETLLVEVIKQLADWRHETLYLDKSKQIKTNGFLVRNVTIGLVGNAFQEALI
ncbi:hypothetical protein BpHYR1_053493 [Brachionus plicatilis]|uniref:HTH psq-type domain-containing protein n=1 Tax=Brachionus plicatilis TaxID=10195 RepID=A0A3M7Q2E7_BRAPC|nr:hypothetical protein BpHYR1_053493 [Brachionus plicatilis]